MIDRYSVEKIIDGHRADAVKAAEQERLMSQLAAAPPTLRPAGGRAAGILRALVFAGGRRPDDTGQMEGC